jgi:hypothetical protein
MSKYTEGTKQASNAILDCIESGLPLTSDAVRQIIETKTQVAKLEKFVREIAKRQTEGEQGEGNVASEDYIVELNNLIEDARELLNPETPKGGA